MTTRHTPLSLMGRVTRQPVLKSYRTPEGPTWVGSIATGG